MKNKKKLIEIQNMKKIIDKQMNPPIPRLMNEIPMKEPPPDITKELLDPEDRGQTAQE
jgi:hypothetical protein